MDAADRRKRLEKRRKQRENEKTSHIIASEVTFLTHFQQQQQQQQQQQNTLSDLLLLSNTNLNIANNNIANNNNNNNIVNNNESDHKPEEFVPRTKAQQRIFEKEQKKREMLAKSEQEALKYTELQASEKLYQQTLFEQQQRNQEEELAKQKQKQLQQKQAPLLFDLDSPAFSSSNVAFSPASVVSPTTTQTLALNSLKLSDDSIFFLDIPSSTTTTTTSSSSSQPINLMDELSSLLPHSVNETT